MGFRISLRFLGIHTQRSVLAISDRIPVEIELFDIACSRDILQRLEESNSHSNIIPYTFLKEKGKKTRHHRERETTINRCGRGALINTKVSNLYGSFTAMFVLFFPFSPLFSRHFCSEKEKRRVSERA